MLNFLGYFNLLTFAERLFYVDEFSLFSPLCPPPPAITRGARTTVSPAHQQREGVNFKATQYLERNKDTLMSLFEHLREALECSTEQMEELRKAIPNGLQKLQEHEDSLDGVLELDKGIGSMGGPQLCIHLKNSSNPPQADEADTSTRVFLSNFGTPLLNRLDEFFKDTLQQAKNVATVNNFFNPTDPRLDPPPPTSLP
jgi:hypothetical protein